MSRMKSLLTLNEKQRLHRQKLAEERLSAELEKFKGREWDPTAMAELKDTLEEATGAFAAQGISLPPVTVFALPRFRDIMIYRADLGVEGIKNVLSNAVAKFPNITGEELAEAVAWAWPDYAGSINMIMEGKLQ